MNTKKILPLIAIAFIVLFSACTQTKKDDTSKTGISPYDTLGLAEFQRFKLESEIRRNIALENAMMAPPAQNYAPARMTYRNSAAPRSYRSAAPRYSSSRATNGGYATPRQQPARKKWSHTAKGAVVGGASGAIIGAVANKKNRLGGGVVGAVVGAATGAGIGAIVDKRERQRGYYY